MPGDDPVPAQPQQAQTPDVERADATTDVALEQADVPTASLSGVQPTMRARAAPSFSEQLRHAGARAPVAARPVTAVSFVS